MRIKAGLTLPFLNINIFFFNIFPGEAHHSGMTLYVHLGRTYCQKLIFKNRVTMFILVPEEVCLFSSCFVLLLAFTMSGVTKVGCRLIARVCHLTLVVPGVKRRTRSIFNVIALSSSRSEMNTYGRPWFFW